MVYRLRKNLEKELGICITRSGLVLHWSEGSLAFENVPPWETQSRRTQPKGTGSKRRESGHRRYHRSHGNRALREAARRARSIRMPICPKRFATRIATSISPHAKSANQRTIKHLH